MRIMRILFACDLLFTVRFAFFFCPCERLRHANALYFVICCLTDFRSTSSYTKFNLTSVPNLYKYIYFIHIYFHYSRTFLQQQRQQQQPIFMKTILFRFEIEFRNGNAKKYKYACSMFESQRERKKNMKQQHNSNKSSKFSVLANAIKSRIFNLNSERLRHSAPYGIDFVFILPSFVFFAISGDRTPFHSFFFFSSELE